MFLTLFGGMFLVARITNPMMTASGSAPVEINQDLTTDAYIGYPLGTNGTFIADLTTYTIALDGDLTDWDGAAFETFEGVNLSIGYDATYVYVACEWVDSTNDDDISHWNKTGDINATHTQWAQLDGADDMLTIGFSNGTYTDYMTWTASIRGDTLFAYEHDDAGSLPYVRNINATGNAPIMDNNSVIIPDHTALPNGTIYQGWFDFTPTLSQADTEMGIAAWNGSGDDKYSIEFRRLLDTTDYTDDILLDFTTLTDMSFLVGKENGAAGLDMDEVTSGEYSLCGTNDAATFSFNTLASIADSSLLITGNLWDDYAGYELIVYLDGWADTYGAGAFDYGDVNEITGNWSYLFLYDNYDMPLGDMEVHVEFYPLYDAPFITYQNVSIVDILAPEILGIVDLHDRYPNGMPNDTDFVTVTLGIRDNYEATDDILCNLYSYKDDGVALQTPMTQFSTGGTTFVANISLEYDPAADNNYTYFCDAWDSSNNKVMSEKYWFIYGYTTVITPGFGFIAAIVGLAGASFIIVKKFKK